MNDEQTLKRLREIIRLYKEWGKPDIETMYKRLLPDSLMTREVNEL